MQNKIVESNFNKMMSTSNFDKKTADRVKDLTCFFSRWDIKDVVMGISGGMDSAFVLELLLEVKKNYDLNIHTVFFHHGLHHNEASVDVVEEYLRNKPVSYKYFNLTNIIKSTQEMDETSNFVNTQYAYSLMYTILFRFAQKHNGITIGTTNKDEFSIGWFGKTSDMVVDVQPIHDFHKFEIYNSPLSRNISDSIKLSTPDGNILSGKKDEEVFGCSYNEVASIINLKENNLMTDAILNDYKMLNKLISENYHKLIKNKDQFNPVFL